MQNTHTNLTYNVMYVSPEMAAEWLGKNENRTLNKRRIFTLTQAMERGEWRENGDAIRFDADGTLRDGQHRLTAIVRSGTTQKMLVVTGIDQSAQMTVDTGRSRSFGDTLKLNGVTDYVNVSVLCRAIYKWETGQMHYESNPATMQQLYEVHLNHPELIDSVRVARNVRSTIVIPVAVTGLCHWLFNQIDADDCAFFFDRLRDGQGLVEGDPVFALRKAILSEQMRNGAHNSRKDSLFTTAIMIKAWNAYREGRKIQILKWRVGGSSPEAMPSPV